MSKIAHIIVVDDEADIRDTVDEYLSMKGYRVSGADGGECLRALMDSQGESVDLIILDLTMPGEDGLSLARYLRDNFPVGIIMLTAAGEVADRIVGLEMGADDYLAKPVDLRELLARVKAVLRRAIAPKSANSSNGRGRLSIGRCVLDLDSRELIDTEGQIVPMTAMEYDLLKAFAEHPKRVLSRDQLLDMAHDKDREPFDRSIDIRIARLRRKIEVDPAKPEVIKTVRGAGYIFSPSGV